MKKVDKLADFPSGCYISQFFGKTYDDAVLEAKKSDTVFISYFEQPKWGKSKFRTILVSYEIKDADL